MAPHPFFLLLLLITRAILPALSQNTGDITVGSSIAATENSSPWRSPSGDFAFGFQQLSNSSDLYVLAIWFARIPGRTIVWFERSSYPVPRGSTIRLDAAEGLVLRRPDSTLLFTTSSLGDRVAYASMNNTGNFVLCRSDSSYLWQSFDNPADTILPSQAIPINGRLFSRETRTNFSEGRFYGRMRDDGNFVLETKIVPTNTDVDDTYYSSSTSDQNTSNTGAQLVLDERGVIAVLRRSGQRTALSSPSIPLISDNYYRATLDSDGVFTQYYFPRNFDNNSQWTVATFWPDNICTRIGSGACGLNSVCRLENSRPRCQCPQGFSLADPNDEHGDCNPNFVQNCIHGDNGEYTLIVMRDTDWPLNDYENIAPSTQDQCRNACMSDCFCGVAIFRSNSCWKKRLPLSNGRIDMTLGSTAFLKFRNGDVPSVNPGHPSPISPRNKDQKALILIGSVLLGSSAFINVLFISLACVGFFLIYNKKMPFLTPPREPNSGTNLQCFSYRELAHATDGFKEEIGRGAFGVVYKGSISPNGEKIVAVKKLDQAAHNSEKEFMTEVNVIGQTHHKNLVPLVGFCDEGPYRMLVYEYMSNGTLAGFLFGETKPCWSQRTQIALDVARGLTYLHEECSTQIIHCDIKPQNVLLDDYFTARISYFGLAKLLLMDQSSTRTNIRGTKGYVAPEWFRNTKITVKVDVYSFGVLLLEIVTCRKSVESSEFNEENPILTDWVWDCFADGRLRDLVENDGEAVRDGVNLERFVRVGIWCIQEEASMRPSMRRVFQMLEGSVEVLVPPCPYVNSVSIAREAERH